MDPDGSLYRSVSFKMKRHSFDPRVTKESDESSSGRFSMFSSFVNNSSSSFNMHLNSSVSNNQDGGSWSTLGLSDHLSNTAGMIGGTYRSSSRALLRGDSNVSTSSRSGEWSAAERSERVENDPKLRDMLSNEIKKSRIVTAAGYKAVHHKFLYSEAVEQEMKLAEDEAKAAKAVQKRALNGRGLMRRRSKFGSLMDSQIGISCRELISGGSKSQPNSRRSSLSTQSSFGANNSRRESYNTSFMNTPLRRKTSDDSHPMLRKASFATHFTSNSGESDDSQNNIAPLKKSVVVLSHLNAVERKKLLEDSDNDDMSADKFLRRHDTAEDIASISKSASRRVSNNIKNFSREASSMSEKDDDPATRVNDSFTSQECDESRPCLQRQDSDDSLDLPDIFDGTDGSNLLTISASNQSVYSPQGLPQHNSDLPDIFHGRNSSNLETDLNTPGNDSDQPEEPSDFAATAADTARSSALAQDQTNPVRISGTPSTPTYSNRKPSLRSSLRPLASSITSVKSEHSYTLPCAYLPWPKRNDDDDNILIDDFQKMDDCINIMEGDLLEPFQSGDRHRHYRSEPMILSPKPEDELRESAHSSYQGGDVFLPWPDKPDSED